MFTTLSVMSSDAKNRYGFYILIQALESGILQTYEGGMPYLINHDAHRPIGWNKPFALFVEPQLTRQLSINLFPETDEEQQTILNLHINFRNKKYDHLAEQYIDDFKLLLQSHGITTVELLSTNCLATFQKDVASRLFPELFNKKDKEGLINLRVINEHLEYLGQGVFKDKKSDLTLFAHPYFRRSQSVHNMTNGQFLDEFISLIDNPALDLYLCLDEDQVGFAPSFHNYMELEYVFGPTLMMI